MTMMDANRWQWAYNDGCEEPPQPDTDGPILVAGYPVEVLAAKEEE